MQAEVETLIFFPLTMICSNIVRFKNKLRARSACAGTPLLVPLEVVIFLCSC